MWVKSVILILQVTFDNIQPATLGMAGGLLAVIDPVIQQYAMELGGSRPRHALRYWRAPDRPLPDPRAWLESAGFEQMTGTHSAEWAGLRLAGDAAIVAVYDDDELLLLVYPSRSTAERYLDKDIDRDIEDQLWRDPVRPVVEAYLAYRDSGAPAPDLDAFDLTDEEQARASVLLRIFAASQRVEPGQQGLE